MRNHHTTRRHQTSIVLQYSTAAQCVCWMIEVCARNRGSASESNVRSTRFFQFHGAFRGHEANFERFVPDPILMWPPLQLKCYSGSTHNYRLSIPRGSSPSIRRSFHQQCSCRRSDFVRMTNREFLPRSHSVRSFKDPRITYLRRSPDRAHTGVASPIRLIAAITQERTPIADP